MFLLHTHTEDVAPDFFTEVILHGFLDTLKLLPFLFLTYLLMELLEHRASDKAERFMRRAGSLGPLVGGALGVLPQCGFSAAASSFYSGGVISIGTLIAVFLSTSDEMLPILLSGSIPPVNIVFILLYKTAVAIAVGFGIDLLLRLLGRGKREIDIDALCESDRCHCERGVFYSALHHTFTVGIFVLIVTVAVGALVFFVGEEALGSALAGVPVLSHLLAAIIGLIPSCAVSVALATLAAEGIISVGVMLSGLFSGAGVGILVLIKTNHNRRDIIFIIGVLVAVGTVFGLLGELFLSLV